MTTAQLMAEVLAAMEKCQTDINTANVAVKDSSLTAAEKKAIEKTQAKASGDLNTPIADVKAWLANPPTVPSAPTDLSVTSSAGSLAASWSAPDDGGSLITDYEVSAVSESAAPVTVSTTATEETITGLVNGTEYEVSVVAVNEVGTGPASAPVTATPEAPATVPGAPTNVVVTPGNGELSITWDAPESDGGSPITGYVPTVTPAS